MKILVFGGSNSGKSKVAEEITLNMASKKPYYIATYLDNFEDKSMREKIELHKQRRKEKFKTIEEPFCVSKILKDDETYLLDCLSMLVFNYLQGEEELFFEIEKISTCKANIVFVLDDVNSGIIPSDKLSRNFAKLSGKVGQTVASFCDEVYEVKYGIKVRIK